MTTQPANSNGGSPSENKADALSGIGQALARCTGPDELYRTLYRLTSGILDTTGYILGTYDELAQAVTVVFQVDSGAELPGGSFPLGNGFSSQVIQTGQPRLIHRWSSEGPRVRIQYATDRKGLPESGITVPLLLGARVTGFLSVQSYLPDAYDDTDLLRLQVIASQAAVAIEQLHSSAVQSAQQPERTSGVETIIANMSEGLLVVDPRGCITRLNRAARELLCPEDGTGGIVLGQPLDEEKWGQWPLGPRSVAQALTPLIDALHRGESISDLEVEILASGRQVFSFSCSPLRDANGATTGGVIVFRDVTGRREVERIKDEVLSIASHELKSPITVIKGHAQRLQRMIVEGRDTTETLSHGLDTIVSSSNRLVEMLDLLMDISRIEAGRFELNPTPTELVSIASTVIERIQSLATNHRLILKAPAQIRGQWDVRRVEQLFQNLLSNAVKYSPDGGLVEIGIEVEEAKVTVRVRDEGIGIEPEELPRLFDRFFRAEGVLRLEGTGLGLYICQGIVSAYGGRIWAESAGRGLGSVFGFTLPRALSHREAEEGPS